MKKEKEEMLVEVGSYKLYQGEYKGEMVTSVIKCGFMTYLVSADHDIPKEEQKDFLATMLNFGRLCDSYMSKKQALKDFEYLKSIRKPQPANIICS